MNTSDIVLFLSVLIAVIQSALSLECHVCNSEVDEGCVDLGKRSNTYLKECRDIDTSCMMQTTQMYERKDGTQQEGILLVTRFCGTETWTGCTELDGARSLTTQCSCDDDDGCNAAPSTHGIASGIMMVVAGLVAAWNIH